MQTEPLKIAIISAHSCPVGDLGAKDTGGMSVYIRELARELGKQGHTVDIYTRIHDPADPLTVVLGDRARLIHLRAGREESINKLLMYCYLPEFCCNLEGYRSSQELSYDLVFSHYWLSGWVGENLSRWWKVPHVIMFHTLGAVKNAIGIGEDSPELRVASERDLAGSCQRIIVATEREKQELVTRYGAMPRKIGVVPCGVNLELFRPMERRLAREKLGLNDARLLLFVGRIDPLKGIDRLLMSLAHLDKFAGLRLLIIGGDENSRDELDKLERLAAALGIREKVSFRGIVRHEDLPLYYSAADVCVVPSYYESFGLVALESLACGTPVVASDVGDLRNIIRPGETGLVSPDNSPEDLAVGISYFLSRGPLDTETRNAIRSTVVRFNWAEIARRVTGELELVQEGWPAALK